MKLSVYLETSIISYLAARPSRDLLIAAHQQVTHEWWATAAARFELCISEAVVQEASLGDAGAASKRLVILQGLQSIPLVAAHGDLAGRIMRGAGLPERGSVDALHIAVAATRGVDILLTWNCKHIANPVFRPRIESVCRQAGLAAPTIATPIEMLGM